MQGDVLVKVEGLSKKFCKDLKTSLWYGAKDLVSGVLGIDSASKLRDKEFWAIRDINFELRRGECLGLIGHNGAGKSTLLKILNGLINPDEGIVTLHGRVGALIELGAGFNPILTGRENIYNNGAILGFTRSQIDSKVEQIIDFAEIREFIDMPVQNYSSGMKVRLGFSVAAQMEPDILIIDEVLAVGDVGFRFKCLNAIGNLMKNAAVIFVSHTMPQVFRICTEVLLLDKGTSLYQGNDLGKGVELYFNMFASGAQQNFGSGEARVSDFQLKSDSLSISNVDYLKVEHGGSLEIEMTVELDSNVDAAMLQMVVWNQDMLPVLDVLGSNLKPFELINSKPKHHIHLTLTQLQLNSGKYTISVIASSKKLDIVYCRVDNLGKFLMTSEVSSGCNLLVPVSWSTN